MTVEPNEREREADLDYEEGRVKTFEEADDFLAELDSEE